MEFRGREQSFSSKNCLTIPFRLWNGNFGLRNWLIFNELRILILVKVYRIKQMKKLLFLCFGLILGGFSQCSRPPCPPSINLGKLDFSAPTKAIFPAAQQVHTMNFVNTAGQAIVFNTNGVEPPRQELVAEILCDRGILEGRTQQRAFYEGEYYEYSYSASTATYPNLELSVRAYFQNTMEERSTRRDTSMVEVLEVLSRSGETNGNKKSSVIIMLTTERGNSAKIPDSYRSRYTHFRRITDTTLNGRPLKNVLVSTDFSRNGMQIYYTGGRGIEAFSIDSTLWLRQ